MGNDSASQIVGWLAVLIAMSGCDSHPAPPPVTFGRDAMVSPGPSDAAVTPAQHCAPTSDCGPGPDAGAPDSGVPPRNLHGILHDNCADERVVAIQLPHDASECGLVATSPELTLTISGNLPIEAPETFRGTDGVVHGSHCTEPEPGAVMCVGGMAATVTFDTYDVGGRTASGRFTLVVGSEIYEVTFDLTLCGLPC